MTKKEVNGAARIVNPLKGLDQKEGGLVKEGVKQLSEDIKLGSDLGKKFGTDIQDSACQ